MSNINYQNLEISDEINHYGLKGYFAGIEESREVTRHARKKPTQIPTMVSKDNKGNLKKHFLFFPIGEGGSFIGHSSIYIGKNHKDYEWFNDIIETGETRQ